MKFGECDVESRHLQDCSPRLCRLRTDELASWASTERTDHMLVYGPDKPSIMLSTEGDFTPTASMVASERETGYGPTNRSAIVLWIRLGAFFFAGAVTLFIAIDDFAKGFYTQTTWGRYGQEPYVNCVWKACDVLVGFFPIRCTLIWITATLGYEYRLFVAVIM
jgi:hypothetical protein